MSYWEKRAEDILIENEKTALEYERELILEYEKAIKNINREVRAFYAQYAEDNKIDLLEANQRLKKKELMSFKLAVKDYLQMIKQVGDDIFTEDYEEVLQDLLDRMHVSRLQELELNIQNEIEQLRVKQEKGLTEVLQETYKTSYDKINESLKLKAKQDVSFTSPGKQQLETAIKEKWLEDNYSGRIWKNKTKLVTEVKQLLQQEFVRGRSPEEVALDLSNKMGVNLNNTRRLIRTELNYISNKGTMKAYEESGVVDSFQYVSTLDNRSSDICREMDGKIFSLKEKQVGVNVPPLHPYCRSTTIPYFPDDEIAPLIESRIARDKQGKSYIIDSNVSYKDWIQEHATPGYAQKVNELLERYKVMDIPPQEVIETEEVKDKIKPLNEKEIKKLNSKLEEFKEFEGEINEILANAGPEYQRMFYKTAMKLKTISNFDPTRGAFYQNYGLIPGYAERGSAININLKFDKILAAEYNISPFIALFHEMGHAIDSQMGKGGKKLHCTNKKFVKAMKKDLSKLLDWKGDLHADASREFERNHKTKGIQDILSGAKHLSEEYNNHNIPIKWQHTDEYWTKRDTEDEMASELFAHLNTTFIDKDYADIYNKYMPESMKEYNAILENVYKKLK